MNFRELKRIVLGSKAKMVYSPMNGEVFPLAKSKDPVHRKKMLGKGVLIIPREGNVFAPFDGKVEMVYETQHALGLVSDDGVELMIHVGLDTVKLNGKHFKAHVKNGQKINKGDLLLEFDIEKIISEGYEIEIPIIITNTADYSSIEILAKGTISINEEMIIIYSQ